MCNYIQLWISRQNFRQRIFCPYLGGARKVPCVDSSNDSVNPSIFSMLDLFEGGKIGVVSLEERRAEHEIKGPRTG